MAVQDEHAITVSFPGDSVKLKENIIKHKAPILQSLLPSQLWILVKKFGLDEKFVINTARKKQATLLYGEVLKRGAYEDFLGSLEENTDHMGHSYIISLLKDTQFAPEKEIKESEIILKRIDDHIDIILRGVCVKTLEPLLIEEKLVTDDELDELRNTAITKQKVKILLLFLKTKGPKAHFIFLHKCLERDLFHHKLFTLLTTNSKKRKLCDPEMAKDRKKKNIYVVQPPEGITTERYIKTISQIRHCYQSENRDSWKVADEIIDTELRSQDNPLEVNIAIILESCTPLITDNRLEDVLCKVERARKMCKELYNKGCDVQTLEGRCEWVLARMYKFRGDYNQAEECINQAFVYITHCQTGEERLLVSFEQACILLIKCDKIKSSLKFGLLNTVKNSLCMAKNLAEEQDYGTNMVQRCKIHLAQVHLHNHSFDMDTNKNAIPSAKQLLLEIKQQDMQPRLQCEYFHISAKIHRIEGNKDLASEHLKHALEINKKYALQLGAILV